MANDEQAIRDLIAEWARASAAGDLDRVLSLMTEDVVFLLPGQPPMRKADFAAVFRSSAGKMQIDAKSDLQEVAVEGSMAYTWNHLTVTATLAGSAPIPRSGNILTIFRKQSDGRWLLARDANLLALDAPA